MKSMTAVAAAPTNALTKVFDADAVAGALGCRSTIKVLRTLNGVEIAKPIRKTRTSGIATDVSDWRTQP